MRNLRPARKFLTARQPFIIENIKYNISYFLQTKKKMNIIASCKIWSISENGWLKEWPFESDSQ